MQREELAEGEASARGKDASAGNGAYLSQPQTGPEEHLCGTPALLEEWEQQFGPLLGNTVRWKGFSFIVRGLLGRGKPTIVETGTLRDPGNWVGDGCSTLVWDWVVRATDGQLFSVDIQEVPAIALGPKSFLFQNDSVQFLRNYTGPAPDLLYLDSYDYLPRRELNACMHQVAELSSIWRRLPPGCLIASDDSHSQVQGKPALTRCLFSAIGIEPVLDSYIVVWRKP